MGARTEFIKSGESESSEVIITCNMDDHMVTVESSDGWITITITCIDTNYDSPQALLGIDETKPAPPTFKRGKPGTLIGDDLLIDLDEESEAK